MYKLHEKASKLMEMAMPMLNNMTDDTGTAVSERELDAALKVVELAHYLLEICMMEDQMKGSRMDAVEVKRPL